jgi:hypothetical protein
MSLITYNELGRKYSTAYINCINLYWIWDWDICLASGVSAPKVSSFITVFSNLWKLVHLVADYNWGNFNLHTYLPIISYNLI